MDNFNLKKYLAENKLLKEELTWFIDDENTDVRYKNDAYLKEVGDKIKELYPDISDEDLNKIIIMTGDQYSREEDFHGDSITSSNFVDAAVEIYQTDILSTRSDDEDGKYFHPDSPFRKDGVFGGWSQAQYDAYQENPRKYEKYLMRGGGWEITENKLVKEDANSIVNLLMKNQKEVAEKLNYKEYFPFDEVRIDDLGDASIVLQDEAGGLSFRYPEDVDSKFRGQDGDKPRPVTIGGVDLMYIGYNI